MLIQSISASLSPVMNYMKFASNLADKLRDISALPTRRIHGELRAATGLRVGMAAAAYVAGATEYLVSEVFDLAGDRRSEKVREKVSIERRSG